MLVLLPTLSAKLLVHWHGPYEVNQQIGKVNYLVSMPDRRKRRRTFHINMLCKWNEPASHNYFVEEEVRDGGKLEALVWNGRRR